MNSRVVLFYGGEVKDLKIGMRVGRGVLDTDFKGEAGE